MRFSFFYIPSRYIVLLFVCIFFTASKSFAQKSVFKKANQLYKNEQYAQAIPLYLEVLETQKTTTAMTKLAQCYRITNQTEKASALFAEIVQSPKAKAITHKYYAEALVSLGNYAEGKTWLKSYIAQVPEDTLAQRQLVNIDRIRDIEPVFPNLEIQTFPYNSEADDLVSVFWQQQLLFSSDRKQGAKLLKQKAGWTGRDFLRIYSCAEDSLYQYQKPSAFSSKINELNKNTANPTFWRDTLNGIVEIYFVRNSFELSKKNEYNLQLFRAESANEGKTWRKVEVVNFCNNELNYMHPALSISGDTLYFVAEMRGGYGGTDIYFSTRKKDNTWMRPQNMGARINTPMHEGFPSVDTQGNFYFCSKGHVGYGGFDVFVTRKSHTPLAWLPPTNLGTPINSSADDISIAFTSDGREGAFTSSREGRDDDIYLFNVQQTIEDKKGGLLLKNDSNNRLGKTN